MRTDMLFKGKAAILLGKFNGFYRAQSTRTISHTGTMVGTIALALGIGIFSAAATSEDDRKNASTPVQVAYAPSKAMWVPMTPADLLPEDGTSNRQPNHPASNGRTSAPVFTTETIKMKRGDTLGKLLQANGLSGTEAHQFVTAMSSELKPRHLKAGQNLIFTRQAHDQVLRTVSIRTDVDKQVVITRDGREQPFNAATDRLPLTTEIARAEGTITSSLYLAADKADVPDEIIIKMIELYSFDVDFQRDIQPNDKFEVLYEQSLNDEGTVVKTGPIQFASLTLQGQTFPLYRHTPKGEEHADYFDDKGRAARKTIMRTPIDGARISSGYGTRKHPILGYKKAHRGVDFAARKGTPIKAAGDGVIDFAGRNGGYGIYMRIRHNGEFSTAYAHMSAIKKGNYKGKRVRQGETIGYVGSTGRSTGPHLHYEILKNGKQVNPQKVRLPTGRILEGKKLTAFELARATIDQTRSSASKLARLDQ